MRDIALNPNYSPSPREDEALRLAHEPLVAPATDRPEQLQLRAEDSLMAGPSKEFVEIVATIRRWSLSLFLTLLTGGVALLIQLQVGLMNQDANLKDLQNRQKLANERLERLEHEILRLDARGRKD